MPRSLDESAGDLLSAMGQAARRSQGPASFVLGEVTAHVPANQWSALRIQCGGNELRAEDLWANEGLTGQELEAGERVVLLTQDEQVYYLLCKVVPL